MPFCQAICFPQHCFVHWTISNWTSGEKLGEWVMMLTASMCVMKTRGPDHDTLWGVRGENVLVI